MATIQPNQIHGYPEGGELKYLFRKRVSQTDIKQHLVLVGDSNDYFRTLPKPNQDLISQRLGLDIDLYTPRGIFDVSIKCSSLSRTNYTLLKDGWYDAALDNRINVGDEIDCWVLYLAKEGGVGTFSLLIQKVLNQAQEAAEGEEGGNSSQENKLKS